MKTIIIIPARYQSSRFPAKMLEQLAGRSVIEYSYRTACCVKGIDEIYIATDHKDIEAAAAGFGAKTIMTSPTCKNGTERIAEAIGKIPDKPDVVINLQGDAPLTPAWFVEAVVKAFEDPGIQVATPVLRCSQLTYDAFKQDRQQGRVGATTVVFNDHSDCLYFSKEVIPHLPDNAPLPDPIPVFHHVGLYGYRPEAIAQYSGLAEGRLERIEGLEQLRFLENNIAIRGVEVDPRDFEFWEVNNPEDIGRIEGLLRERGDPNGLKLEL